MRDSYIVQIPDYGSYIPVQLRHLEMHMSYLYQLSLFQKGYNWTTKLVVL